MLDWSMFPQQRKSSTTQGSLYFWTATIHNWYHLLEDDTLKDIIIESLRFLSTRKKITVFGFVIMPNHIHLIWQLNERNGKESSKASFMKYTAHQFKKKLAQSKELQKYRVYLANKDFEFWMRDSLSVEIISRDMALQKLNYIHANPVSGKWTLAKDDVSYNYSSASFYETGVDEFGFLHDLFEVFDGE